MTFRHVLMLTVGAAAGVLSGCLWLFPNGLMGGALGMSLAAGAIWLGSRRQRPGGEPARGQVLHAGLLSGLLGGVLMAALSHACAGMARHDFGPPVLPLWAPVVMGVGYGLVIHWGYATRRSSLHPLRTALFRNGLGCFVLKALATALYLAVPGIGQSTRDPGEVLFAAAMISLLGAVPFALLWTLGMAWLDPAFRAGPLSLEPRSEPPVPA